jgi:hypothetical protein
MQGTFGPPEPRDGVPGNLGRKAVKVDLHLGQDAACFLAASRSDENARFPVQVVLHRRGRRVDAGGDRVGLGDKAKDVRDGSLFVQRADDLAPTGPQPRVDIARSIGCPLRGAPPATRRRQVSDVGGGMCRESRQQGPDTA